MRTETHSDDRNRTDIRPTRRCFRHHVWMAYCGDCREAHAPLLRRRGADSASDPVR